MSGTLYEVLSHVLRVLVGKKDYSARLFQHSRRYLLLTNSFLYPLDKGFIFVHKPTIYIKFEGIASVNFGRMSGGAGVSRYIL